MSDALLRKSTHRPASTKFPRVQTAPKTTRIPPHAHRTMSTLFMLEPRPPGAPWPGGYAGAGRREGRPPRPGCQLSSLHTHAESVRDHRFGDAVRIAPARQSTLRERDSRSQPATLLMRRRVRRADPCGPGWSSQGLPRQVLLHACRHLPRWSNADQHL